MTHKEMIDAILNDSTRYAFSFEDVHAILSEHESETYDVFCRLAYVLSENMKTERHARNAAKFMQRLALSVLEFNCNEANVSDSLIAALEN